MHFLLDAQLPRQLATQLLSRSHQASTFSIISIPRRTIERLLQPQTAWAPP